MPSITIYHGDDLQRLHELRTTVAIAERAVRDAIEDAENAGPRRAGDPAESEKVREAREDVTKAKAAFDAFVDEAAKRAEEWVIEPIGHEAWRDLLKKHPPRMVAKKGGEDGEQVVHEEDEEYGVNTEEFGKSLLLFVDPEDSEHRTVTKVGDDDLANLGKRLRRLPVGQFDTLWVAAYYLNVSGVTNPKAERYSIATSESTAT